MRKRTFAATVKISSVVSLMLMPGVARAQYTASYQTNFIDGVISNYPGLYCVGTNGLNNDVLQIQNAGVLVLSNRTCILGQALESSNNVVVVSDNGSALLLLTQGLNVGNWGINNQVIITNGGMIADNFQGTIGLNSSSNSVLVTGNGSLWSNAFYISVGMYGAGNQLTIANKGKVYCPALGLGNYSSSVHNVVTVTGTGSVLTNSGGVSVGFYGGGNQLIISNGGVVYDTSASIGNQYSGTNIALVAGSGSVWSNSSDLSIGYYTYQAGNMARDNQLIIADGGAVYSAIGYVGNCSSNNSALVTGAGSIWNNNSDLYVGKAESCNYLTVSNGGMVVNTIGYIGSPPDGQNAVLVTGGGSVWSNRSDLYVGTGGASNALTIAKGGKVYDANAYIGAGYTAVIVSDTGSVWNNSANLAVGAGGLDATLIISNAGTVLAQAVLLNPNTWSSNTVLAVNGGSLITTNAGYGVIDVQRGTMTMDGGTIRANGMVLTNGANGKLTLSGGTLAVNTLTNDGSGNVMLSGGTLAPLNTNASWQAAMIISNSVTFGTVDTDGRARTNSLLGTLSGGGTLNITGSGVLRMNGAVTGGGLITVQNEATLGGTGTLASVQVLSNAHLAAGNSIGTLAMTNLTLAGGAHLQVEINATNGVAGVDWDLINVNGPATLSGISACSPLTLDLVNYGGLNATVGPANNVSWDILDASGGITGYDTNAFAFTVTGLDGWSNGAWSVAQTGNSLQLSFVMIPEPTTLTLVLLVILFLGGVIITWRRLCR